MFKVYIREPIYYVIQDQAKIWYMYLDKIALVHLSRVEGSTHLQWK